MTRRRRRRDRRDPRETAELNITAFMNLMVILVPFLLITAVFSRLAVIELSLPGPDGPAALADEDAFQLEITVRGDRLEVGDRDTGLLKVLANGGGGGYDLAGLSAYLQEVKARYPEKTDATVLLEPDIEYEVLVEVMDAVRVVPIQDATGRTTAFGELFPDIAVGDASVSADDRLTASAAVPSEG
jgi:biopolymer transport protein ExbD